MIINFVFDNFYPSGQPKNNLWLHDNSNHVVIPSSRLLMHWDETLRALCRKSLGKSNHNIKFITTSDAVNNYNTDEKYIYLIELTAIDYYTMWPLYYIPSEITNLVDNDRCKIIIAQFNGFPMLSYGAEPMYKNIHQACIISGIKNLDNILLMIDCAGDTTSDLQNGINYAFESINNKIYHYISEHKLIFPRRGVPRIVESGTWEWMLNDKLFQNDTDYLTPYIQTLNKTHSYLFMNGSAREHRYMMYKALGYLDIRKDSIYSFGNFDELNNYKNNGYFPTMINTTTLLSDDVQNFKQYLISNPIINPVELPNDTIFNQLLADSATMWEAFLYINKTNLINTWFSVVTETGDLSEKTFKLIYYGHPFILVGSRGMIKGLKKLGYKTFDCIFDESYDDMQMGSEKILFIANQIKQYCGEEGRRKISEKLPEIEAILRYNRELFMYKDHNEFWTKL